MKIRYYKHIIITILSITLLGCGFELRSTKSFPPQLKKIYMQTQNPFGKFELDFKRKLKSNKISLLAKPEKNFPIIHLSSNFYHNDQNPSSTTQARVYNLIYTATISITNSYNKKILSPQTAIITKSISLQPNEVFENTAQVATSQQEMAQELSNKMLNILSSPKNTQKLIDLTS